MATSKTYAEPVPTLTGLTCLQSNILIDAENHVRIADFGLAIIGDTMKGAFSTTRSGRGSEGWKAPERYRDDAARYEAPVDIYAYACLCYMVGHQSFSARRAYSLSCYQLVTGVPPFKDKTEEVHYSEVVMSRLRPAKPAGKACLGGVPVPRDLWLMILRCWRQRSEMRLNIKQVLAYFDIDHALFFQTCDDPHFTTKAVRRC
jgi:serine/threonine protein kinase